MNEIFSVHYKIMAMTMVRNEGGKGKGKTGKETAVALRQLA